MKRVTLGTLLAMAGVAATPGIACAQDAQPAATAAPAAVAPPASPLSFNAGVVTDYRYRGISQSRLDPALQGGADYAATSGANADTFELYGAIRFGMFTAKYSLSLTNLLGYADSKGSGDLDLSANVDLGSNWSLTPHIGHQTVHNTGVASYTDYSLALGKDLGNGVSLTTALLGTDANKGVYITPAGKFTGKSGAVLGAKYTC